MIAGISSRRREQVDRVDLDEAVTELERRARRVEIRCPNEVLRVLQELGRLRELVDGLRDQVEDAGFALPLEGTYAVVVSTTRNADQEHARAPGKEWTCCGYDAASWYTAAELDVDDLLVRAERSTFCDRCRRSLHIRLPR